MTIDTDITLTHIDALLLVMSKSMYKATDSEEPACFNHNIMETCHALLAMDYNIMEVANSGGELSTNYPHRLLIPESEIPVSSAANNTNNPQTIYEHGVDATRLRDHWQSARLARCRARFPVPVILYRGRFICRSATLSGCPEMYGRATFESLFGRSDPLAAATPDADEGDNVALEMEESFREKMSAEDTVTKNEKDKYKNYIDQIRANDIKLLKYMNVGVILDLMVEKKKVKYGLNVSSSEKVDKEKRYARFHLAALPYPGCEFFKKYRDNSYSGNHLVYDWTASYNDVDVNAPDIRFHTSFSTSSTTTSPHSKYTPLNICWSDYQKWDLIELTMNYMRVTLHFLTNSNSGMLVHCISGWDRTPLFVSMLRMTLWADGVIHQSLTPNQMLYYTVAYDWYMFGHNLPDRLYKGEDIFFFCFNMLKYLNDKDFCTITPKTGRSKNNSSSSSIGVLRTDSDGALGDHGMIFEEDEDEYNRGSTASLNSILNCDTVDGHFNGEGTRPRRCRTNSGRSNLSYNQSGGSTDSLFAEYGLNTNEMVNGAISPDAVHTNGGGSSTHKTSPMSVPRTGRQRHESMSSIGSWQMVTTTGSYRGSEGPFSPHMAGANFSEHCGGMEDDSMSAILLQRRQRLEALRMAFYKCYWATVGRSKVNGPLGNLRP